MMCGRGSRDLKLVRVQMAIDHFADHGEATAGKTCDLCMAFIFSKEGDYSIPITRGVGPCYSVRRYLGG
jgi:hypothetical protein